MDKQKKNEDTMMIDAETEESLAEMDGYCGDDSQVQELRINQYPFIDEHPGHEFSHLQERRYEVISVTFTSFEKDTI